MANRKTIKINFCDWWDGFQKENNRYYNILKKFYNIEISENPDFLFYSLFGLEHEKYKCVKIFGNGENVIPNFNECDYGEGPDYIEFGNRYFRHNNYFINNSICNRNIDEFYFDRKFCNFIYSNTTSGEGATLRQKFCQKLMQYKHIDCPGKVLNNMSAEELEPRNGKWWESKLEFLKQYKFTIAFENSSSNGYTTEKLVQPLQSFSIPIYWGNPLVTRDFNPKAFINCNDYDNDFDAVINRVKELDNDPDKYLSMLRENPMQPDFDYDQGAKYEKWLVNIIEKGNKPFNKDPKNLSTTAKLLQEIEKLKNLATDNKACIDISTPLINTKEPILYPREFIEWTNTWVEDATDINKKRLLIIGDSVIREVRGQISGLLNNYAIDYIGTSSSLEDIALYNICNTFFDNKIYHYSAILLNIGNKHGYYLHTYENKDDAERYCVACRKFFEYVRKKCPKLVLLTATPDSKEVQNGRALDEVRNKEISYRNELQTQIANDNKIEIVDLYQFVLDKKFEHRDIQHFTAEAQPQIAEYIVSELKLRGLIND